MNLLMIGHLLGDFYFQPNYIAEKKKRSLGYTALHCLIYSLVMFAVLSLVTGRLKRYIYPVLVIGALHLLIDGLKSIIYKVCKLEKWELAVFVIDQFIHILILLVISCKWKIEPNINWIPGISEDIAGGMTNALIIINASLVCGKPAAVLVSLVFNMIPKREGNATEVDEVQEAKIGSWIGILEREIMLILGLFGEYSAIGFVIAAKSLARHKQFDDAAFAERYLVGTLLSSLIALLSVIICSLG